MRVVVTGAAGLIGSAIATALRKSGDVVGIDVRAGTQVDILADISGRDGDLTRAITGANAIIHTAALHAPHVGLIEDTRFWQVNAVGTARLVDLALAHGVGRFVLTSSTSVYGYALVRKGCAAWIDEAVEPEPRDIYDVTKRAAENHVLAAAGNLQATILRMGRCFREPIVDMALYRLHRGVDRRDVVEAHLAALRRPGHSAEIYVISAASPFRPADAEALWSNADGVIENRFPDFARAFQERAFCLPQRIDRVYAIGKAQAELGFRPRHGGLDVLKGDCDPAPLASRGRLTP